MEQQILQKIKEFNRIIIHRHIRPDGDCIGTQHALKKAIMYNFPEKEVYAVGDVIPEYIQEYGTIDTVSEEMYKDALVIVVDTATRVRICNDNWQLGKYIIKIDHHDDSEDYANINYVDEKSPACGSILVRLLKQWNFKLNQEIATYLYLAITTDTGRFRYRGINEEVLSNAGSLLSYGVDTEKLYTNLYIKDNETYKLQGYVYQHYKVTKNGVAYMYFTKDMMKKFNVTKEEAANLVGCMDGIRGSLIWVAFVDQSSNERNDEVLECFDNEIRVRIRSRFVSINTVATHYRGGGHLTASGATVYSKDEMKKLLKELDTLLKQFKDKNKGLF